jgi:uncharacterized protein (DUF362 family)
MSASSKGRAPFCFIQSRNQYCGVEVSFLNKTFLCGNTSRRVKSMKSKISLVKSESHFEGVQQSLAHIQSDVEKSLSTISSLIIKINFVITRTPRYSGGVELATTPFQAVKSFIDFISPFYRGEIIIAERATWGKTKEGFQMYGFAELAEENSQVSLLDLKEDETIVKTVEYPEGKLKLPFSKTMLSAPFLVSIARPKTHCSVVASAGIKNVLVGAINGRWKERLQIHKGNLIHDIMARIADFVYPDLVIIDGTSGMEGNGPIRGTEIKAGWTLASFDALAADSLATYLMGFAVDDVTYLTMLNEKEFGLFYPNDEIEIVGDKPKDLVTPFKPHRCFKRKR